jgi:hypothetical protein
MTEEERKKIFREIHERLSLFRNDIKTPVIALVGDYTYIAGADQMLTYSLAFDFARFPQLKALCKISLEMEEAMSDEERAKIREEGEPLDEFTFLN